MPRSNQASIEIAVQPPPTVGVNRWLVPPVVARTRDPQLLEDYLAGARHLYATAMLYSSSNMEDYTSVLGGNWNASAQLLTESSSRGGGGSSSRSGSEHWLYFIFNPVSVGMEGTFVFNIVVSALSLSADEAGTSQAVGARATRQFTVVSHNPRAERPCRSRSLSNSQCLC